MMRVAIAAAVAAFVALPVSAQEPAPRVAPEDMRWVTPGLADYTDELLFGDMWRRTGEVEWLEKVSDADYSRGPS